MQNEKNLDLQGLSRTLGWSLIAVIVIGIAASMTVSSGIDINLSANITKTSENMLTAEHQLRAKAYVALLLFALEVFISIALFLVLRGYGLVLATWSFMLSISANMIILLSAIYTMNAALIAGNSAFDVIGGGTQRLAFTSLQVAADYTSFHLSLVIGSIANAGFFLLFFKSRIIPKLISGWGVFASLFVATMIVSRDFIPALTHNAVTGAFILANLVSLLVLGLYLGIKGVRMQNY